MGERSSNARRLQTEGAGGKNRRVAGGKINRPLKLKLPVATTAALTAAAVDIGLTPYNLALIGIRRILREHAETGCIVIPAGIADCPGARTITLPAATAARLDLAVSQTGESPAEVIGTALELLLSGSPTPPGSAATIPTRPAAWRHALGWEPAGPPPTMDNLLPPHLQQRLLDIWLTTGTNVLHTEAMAIVDRFALGGPEAFRLVTGSMETDLHSRIQALGVKWEGGKAA